MRVHHLLPTDDAPFGWGTAGNCARLCVGAARIRSPSRGNPPALRSPFQSRARHCSGALCPGELAHLPRRAARAGGCGGGVRGATVRRALRASRLAHGGVGRSRPTIPAERTRYALAPSAAAHRETQHSHHHEQARSGLGDERDRDGRNGCVGAGDEALVHAQ